MSGWGLHVWGDGAQNHTDWTKPLPPSGCDEISGCYVWDIPIKASGGPEGAYIGLLVHKGDQKSARAELTIPDNSSEVWLVGSEQAGFLKAPDLKDVPAGSITKQAAIWVDANTIAWRHPLTEADGRPRSFRLHYSRDAQMSITGAGVVGAEESFELQPAATVLPPELSRKYPYLQFCSALHVPEQVVQQAARLLQGQLLVSMHAPSGVALAAAAQGGTHEQQQQLQALDATGVQLQGVLDDLFTYEGPLGYHSAESYSSDVGSVSVWAPTAQKVELLRWPGPRGGTPEVHELSPGRKGEWSMPVPRAWDGSYYKYRVTVYCPWTLRVEVSEVTDPYSMSLAADGERTQFIDIESPSSSPAGWQEDMSPRLEQWTDISIYELHIRDFSACDDSVPEPLRGKYLAFSPQHIVTASAGEASADGGGAAAAALNRELLPPTAGLQHLAKLRQSGLNHLHLLPTYDFASVPERQEDQARVNIDLSEVSADSPLPQEAIAAVSDQDAFNWGYDPVHWGVPDGSYALQPDGLDRILEFKSMIMAMHAAGWRVVLDVVYNHVYRAGPFDKYSVLDKIVPGYYQRRMEDGEICHSTCCNNTATENSMCERLVVDDILHWAKHYKIDGFRFDIMGHLLVSTLSKMRRRLDELTIEKDGVNGRSIYIYGEAWDFGEMVDNARGVNCGQMNLAGTGLGAFNDRLRDGALGGGPFDPYHYQGLVTGLSLAPNSIQPHQGGSDPSGQLQELLMLTDWVRYSLAGNLRSFPLRCHDGVTRLGGEALAHGLPLAYGALPHENVAFIGCHDNLTIFDQVTEKAALTVSAAERSRMVMLCLSMIALSQGVPFFHAGDDLLRSKSLDRDSYNSGDHFNRVDWTGQMNNFGVGLPPASKNGQGWHYKKKLLANTMIKPNASHIKLATETFQLMLKIRYSSPLFRISDPKHVQQQVSFSNTGPDQIPGLVVMTLTSAEQQQLGVFDPAFKRIVVVFNCSPLAQEVPLPSDCGPLCLHPLAAAFALDTRLSAGCRIGSTGEMMLVAARTTAVFVESR